MCRTIVGVSANLCPVDPEGKNLHSSVSSQFAEGIRQAGGLPMVIPMGDPSLVIKTNREFFRYPDRTKMFDTLRDRKRKK